MIVENLTIVHIPSELLPSLAWIIQKLLHTLVSPLLPLSLSRLLFTKLFGRTLFTDKSEHVSVLLRPSPFLSEEKPKFL